MSANLKEIDRRINDLWTEGRYMDACRLISSELVPAIKDYLCSTYELSMEDAEDAVSDAYQGFLLKISKKGPQSIRLPKPYIWRAAVNRAIDQKKKSRTADIPESQLPVSPGAKMLGPHEHLDQEFLTGATNGLVPDYQIRATYLVEALIGDIEIEHSAAVELVRETLLRLTAPNAEILRHLLQYGADQPAANAARILGMTTNSFGVRKYRAYNKFRQAALKVREELGIKWRGLPEEPIANEATEFPQHEDGADADEQ